MNENIYFLTDFIDELTGIFGKSPVKVILYGSYARGEQSDFSDIDIMILTSMNENQILAVEDAVFDLAYDYELHYGIPISVNIKNEKHFSYWANALPYYRNIEKEGLVLAG